MASVGLVEALRALRFGYLPYAPGAASPGDRRRFPAVAQKLGLHWEIYQPGEPYDVLFVTSNADLTHFRRWPRDGTKIVFDMVDSYLDVPLWDPKSIVRGAGKWLFKKHRHLELFYRNTILGICERADLVICATPEQEALISPVNTNVHPILDFHEELGKVGPRTYSQTEKIDIFWEGLALTASQFSLVAGVLRELAAKYPLRLHFVTDFQYRPINTPWPVLSTKKMLKKILGPLEFYLAEWNPTTIAALAASCDLGIIPLRLDQPLFRAKPENKLLIMWRLGLATVVSATPAYVRTMEAYGGPTWACRDEQEWFQVLEQALGDAELRRISASQGEAYAEREYGVAALTGRWVRALSTLLS